jgi:hypothetical protein
MVLGISMHPFDFTTCVMDNATMGVQIKAQKQTQKQFAHLHNQHRKKVCFLKQLGDFLFSCGTFSDKSGQFTREKASMRQTSDS